METKSILSLPTELLAYITSLLPARDILSFALTCHAFENGASDGLRELQRIFLEYQTLNDNHPLGLLNKLRTILVDPFRAQCVRNLHFYDIRSSWVDWPPLSNIIDNERGEYVSIVDARHASENSNSNWNSRFLTHTKNLKSIDGFCGLTYPEVSQEIRSPMRISVCCAMVKTIPSNSS